MVLWMVLRRTLLEHECIISLTAQVKSFTIGKERMEQFGFHTWLEEKKTFPAQIGHQRSV